MTSSSPPAAERDPAAVPSAQVDGAYADLIHNNRSLLKRFSHGRRFEVAIRLLDPAPGDRILDYGTGDGHMLVRLAQTPCEQATGFEPFPDQFEELRATVARLPAGRTRAVAALAELESGSFDKVCCLEVLEHLPARLQQESLAAMARLVKPSGLVLVSVPIEIGAGSLFKNVARLALRQTHDGTSLSTIGRAALGLPVSREGGDYMPSHLGFDHRELEKQFAPSGLVLQRRDYSPFPPFGTVVNSQIFYLLARAR